MDFNVVLINVGVLLALSLPGFFLRKFDKFNDAAVKVLVVLLVYSAQPAMVAKSLLSLKFSKELGVNIAIALSVFGLVIFASFCMARLVFASGANRQAVIGQQKTQNNRVYQFACMFGNTGYLGLPVIMLLFPGNQVMLLYASLCIVLFNLLTWTVGVWIITGDKQYISVKKGLISPVPITALVALPIFFISSFVVPQPVISFFDSLGSMTTPLSMIILGARMAELPFKDIVSDIRIYVTSFLRLIAAPVVAFCIMKLFNVTDAEMFNAVMIVCMMPCAVSTIVLAERYLDNSYTAIKAVLLSSLLCVLTIPLFSTFFLI